LLELKNDNEIWNAHKFSVSGFQKNKSASCSNRAKCLLISLY
jgi:hypothetical protein